MANLNVCKMTLGGHLCDKPEIERVDKNNVVCNFSVAVNHDKDNVSFIKWNILDWGSVDSGKSVSVIGTLDESFRHGKWHETIKTSQTSYQDLMYIYS